MSLLINSQVDILPVPKIKLKPDTAGILLHSLQQMRKGSSRWPDVYYQRDQLLRCMLEAHYALVQVKPVTDHGVVDYGINGLFEKWYCDFSDAIWRGIIPDISPDLDVTLLKDWEYVCKQKGEPVAITKLQSFARFTLDLVSSASEKEVLVHITGQEQGCVGLYTIISDSRYRRLLQSYTQLGTITHSKELAGLPTNLPYDQQIWLLIRLALEKHFSAGDH